MNLRDDQMGRFNGWYLPAAHVRNVGLSAISALSTCCLISVRMSCWTAEIFSTCCLIYGTRNKDVITLGNGIGYIKQVSERHLAFSLDQHHVRPLSCRYKAMIHSSLACVGETKWPTACFTAVTPALITELVTGLIKEEFDTVVLIWLLSIQISRRHPSRRCLITIIDHRLRPTWNIGQLQDDWDDVHLIQMLLTNRRYRHRDQHGHTLTW